MPPTEPNNIDPSIEQIINSFIGRKMQEQENGIDFIKKCCKLLSAYGVKNVVFDYDGSGDSGDFNYTSVIISPTIEQADKCLSESSTVSTDLIESGRQDKTVTWKNFVGDRRKEKNPMITAEMCDTMLDNVFSLLPGGWEIDDGSFGTINIDIATEKITVEHNERITEINTETRTY